MTALVVDDSRAMRIPGPVSLMLVDWNMPEMNGLELVKKVRSDSRYASTTIVMVTTETEMEQMASALEAGADEYVMKPFTKDILEDKLRMVVKA
jgi:two-component system, chemotaxis family, chemotaxis protein CheY